MLTERYIS